jgi:hypothetical protein
LREYRRYGKCEYQRLAAISVSHLYNLRQQPRYRERRLHYVKTRPTAVAIGERRRPDPRGRPGYLRVDTVHQGDPPGTQGVFHIDAVDEITQWQIVSASARISKAWLEPVLEAMLRPKGSHCPLASLRPIENCAFGHLCCPSVLECGLSR